MPRRSVIAIGEAYHAALETTLKKGVPVSNRRRRNAAEEEALRLRVETAERERKDFGTKTETHLDSMEAGFVNNDDSPQDEALRKFFSPEAYEQLSEPCGSTTGYSIMEEIAEASLNQRLRPFVEGEPIGVIQNHPKPTAARSIKTRAEIMDEHVKELHERQRHNDATLDALLKRVQ